MNLKKLDILKERLAKAPVLADVYKYFLDHFGEDEKFLDLGGRVENEMLQMFLTTIAGHLYGPTAVVGNFLFVRLPDHHFIHGACMMDGHPANVLYFDDIEVGMVGIMPIKRGEETRFSRFSGRKLPEGYIGSDN